MIAVVYMNHGRWVVDCPNPECGWAYMATTPDGRPRYQYSCVGSGADRGCGYRLDLAWPELDEALEVERILFARAAPSSRNWKLPETVESLLFENDQLLVGWTLAKLADAGIGGVE
jgi:hypothetical protein